MIELPSYFTQYQTMFTEEMLTTLGKLEDAFAWINYEDHADEIAQIFMEPEDMPVSDVKLSIFSIYRTAIDRVLNQMGITLTNPWDHPLHVLTDIVFAATLLSTNPIEDILDGFSPVEEDDDTAYVCDVFGFIMERSMQEVMGYIEEASSATADIFRREHTEEVVELSPVAPELLQRFRRIIQDNPRKDGFVVEYVKQTGNLGYKYDTVFQSLYDMFDEVSDDVETFAEELRILIAGSSIDITDEEAVDGAYENILLGVITTPMQVSKLTAYLYRRPLHE